MIWTSFVVFFSFIFGCLAPAPSDDDLKPLNLPSDFKIVDGDSSNLSNMLKKFNINFLLSQFKRSSKDASIYQRLWSSALSYKYLFIKNAYPNACASKRTKGVATVTAEGHEQCEVKCVEENENYVKFVNKNLPQVFNALNKTDLKAKFDGINKDLHECAPGFIYGFNCICKRNVKVMVNEKLQDMIDEIFDSGSKTKDANENDIDQVAMKKRDQTKTTFVSRFLGLWAVLLTFPSKLPSYLIWWQYTSK